MGASDPSFELDVLTTLPDSNDFNIYQYCPIVQSNPLQVDEEWFSSIPDFMKQSLRAAFPTFTTTHITYP